MVLADCNSCGKRYKVREAGHAYKCRECGGRVIAPASDAGEASDGDAEETSAAQRKPVRRRAEPKPPGRKVARRRPGPPDEEARERIAIAKQLAGVRQSLQAIRLLFLVVGGLSLVGLVVAVVTPGRGPQSEETNTAIIVLASEAALVTTLFLVGALRIFKNPFFWSILLTSLLTFSVAGRWSLDVGVMVAKVFWTLVCLGMWSVVRSTWKARDVIREHPGLWATLDQHTHRLERGDEETARDRVDERKARKNAASRKLQLILVASVVVVLVGGWFTYKYVTRPPEVRDAVSRFAEEWKAGNIDAIVGMLPEDARDRMGRGVRRLFETRGWTEAMPGLGELDLEVPDSGRVRAAFPCDDGTLLTFWSLRDGAWFLTRLDPP